MQRRVPSAVAAALHLGRRDRDGTSHQVTVQIPEDADTVVFGIFLSERGRIEMRKAELTRRA